MAPTVDVAGGNLDESALLRCGPPTATAAVPPPPPVPGPAPAAAGAEFKLCRLVLLPSPEPAAEGVFADGVLCVISSRKSRTDWASAADGAGGLCAFGPVGVVAPAMVVGAAAVLVVRADGRPAPECGRKVEWDAERATVGEAEVAEVTEVERADAAGV